MPQHDNVVPFRRDPRAFVVLRSDNIRGAAPIPARDLHAIFDLPAPRGIGAGEPQPAPNLYDERADAGEVPPGVAIASEYGGLLGALIMFAMAVVVGFLLAAGGW